MEFYTDISLEKAIECRQVKQAAHCALFYKEVVEKKDSCNKLSSAFFLMQIRSDGMIGFPGGYVDEEITDSSAILVGLNRELKEEINFSEEPMNMENYVCSHYKSECDDPLIVHFFAKQLSKKQFENIEKSHMTAIHFPSESL
ncbi:hypothetical protein B4U80_03028, partial [Leptotrombidium deliense]